MPLHHRPGAMVHSNISISPSSTCQTAMADIFCIDEILRTFLFYCDKPTLARLARTAKVFSDPALDVLWETLESFSYLLKLFPQDLISWIPCDKFPPKPTVNHLIVPRDWKRVTPYACRIRNWTSEDLSYIEEPVVDHLAFGRLPDYILPRLTHMEVTATSVSGVHLQTFLLCPSLESVTVWNTDQSLWAGRAMNTFFRTLADRAPNLKKLIVHWGDSIIPSLPFIEGLSDVFTNPRFDLHTVNLWSPLCVAPKSFYLLSQLPNLTTLHLNLIGMSDASSLCSQIKNKSEAFPSLQNVFLAGMVDEFQKVLRYFSDQQMISLGFSVREYPKAKSLTQLFHVVAASFTTLRVLQFNVPKEEIDSEMANRHYDANPDAYYCGRSVLQPLLAIRSLSAVHIELGVPLCLSNADLRVIGTSWPKIEVLDLCSDPYCEQTRLVQPVADFEGLRELVFHCARLKHLGLYIDYSSFLSEETIADMNMASNSLIHLDVGRSWLIEPPLVAAALSGAFPNLKVFQWCGMEGQEDDMLFSPESVDRIAFNNVRQWRQVYDLLPIFKATRANERRRQLIEGTEVQMIVD